MKIWAEVHYHDAKGRQYRLEHLADELENMGIEVNGTGFNDDYDGYVDVSVSLEQAKKLYEKYPARLYICGRGSTIEEKFADAFRIQEMTKRIVGL